MHNVDLSPLFQTINEVLLVFLTGLAAAAASAVGVWLKKHFKLTDAQTDAAISNAMNTALTNGANIAINSLEQYEGEHSTVAVKGWIASKAAQYAIDHNQDYLKRFTGMTPDDVAEKALAFIPPVAVADSTVVVKGALVTLGKPSPAVPEKEETAALNKAQV